MATFSASHLALSKLVFCLCLLIFSCRFSNGDPLKIIGVDSGIAGNFEKFTCEYTEHSYQRDLSETYPYHWSYMLKDGSKQPVTPDDELSNLENPNEYGKKTSFIRLKPDIKGIYCNFKHYGQYREVHKYLQVLDLFPVTAEDEPCQKAEMTRKPVTVVQMTSLDFPPAYRKAFYTDDKTILVKYPGDVSQVKLTCFSYHESSMERPTWSMKKGQHSNIKFTAWGLPQVDSVHCRRQILEIYAVTRNHKDVEIDFSLHCRVGSERSSQSSPVKLRFEFDKGDDYPTIRITNNETEICVTNIVDSFYDKDLTSVSVGGSLAIILMMVGTALLKKQLDNQKKENEKLQQRAP